YGEFQNLGDKYRNVVGIFMNQLMQGRPLTIFGDGSQTRAFSYIGDVAPYIANSVNIQKCYNEVFNIGADKEYSVNELAHTIMEAMEIKEEIRYVEARNEVVHAFADHSKVHAYFGSKTKFSLVEGINKMANWAKVTGI